MLSAVIPNASPSEVITHGFQTAFVLWLRSQMDVGEFRVDFIRL